MLRQFWIMALATMRGLSQIHVLVVPARKNRILCCDSGNNIRSRHSYLQIKSIFGTWAHQLWEVASTIRIYGRSNSQELACFALDKAAPPDQQIQLYKNPPTIDVVGVMEMHSCMYGTSHIILSYSTLYLSACLYGQQRLQLPTIIRPRRRNTLSAFSAFLIS